MIGEKCICPMRTEFRNDAEWIDLKIDEVPSGLKGIL